MAKHLNTNKQFMLGNGILAFAVIFIVVIFVYMSLRLSNKQEVEYDEMYTIILEDGFLGKEYEVQLNDSVLYRGAIGQDNLKYKVKRFADQSALLLIDLSTHDLRVFNLNAKGGEYGFNIHNGTIEQVYVK